ncbi:MAG TPA: F0F1 ATP synthase subunit epsilon [Pyrinomonadaceae bacterium]|jgi:F-type H+-transporting ATPase subunit epsilon
MLRLEIVTPEKKVVDETVDAVTVPGANGEIGILPNHAPLISTLKPGILAYTRGGATERLVISGGFIEVSADKVSVLADVAETADEIDVEAARSEREATEKALGAWSGSEADFEIAKERLERAQARLQLAGR